MPQVQVRDITDDASEEGALQLQPIASTSPSTALTQNTFAGSAAELPVLPIKALLDLWDSLQANSSSSPSAAAAAATPLPGGVVSSSPTTGLKSSVSTSSLKSVPAGPALFSPSHTRQQSLFLRSLQGQEAWQLQFDALYDPEAITFFDEVLHYEGSDRPQYITIAAARGAAAQVRDVSADM